jgi:hypothetical protein
MRRSHLLPPALVLTVLCAGLGPVPLRRLARGGLALYMASVLAASVAAARRGRAADVPALPAVFATMHVAWGVGFLAGCARFGPPLAALARIAGLGGGGGGRGPITGAARAGAAKPAPSP